MKLWVKHIRLKGVLTPTCIQGRFLGPALLWHWFQLQRIEIAWQKSHFEIQSGPRNQLYYSCKFEFWQCGSFLGPPLPFQQPAWQQQEAGAWRTHWCGPDRHGLPTSAVEQEPSVAWLRGLHEVTLYCKKVCRRDLLIKKALLDFDSGGFCKSATGAKFKNWSLSHTARSSSKAFLCKNKPRPEWVASDVVFCFKRHF